MSDPMYRSCAEWPIGTITVLSGRPDISTDLHFTKEQANGVCNLLMRDGFGGDRKIFPIKTWVETVTQ